MTQEEKAKAYDEALKVLHKYDGANIMFSQDLKEEMFPELKESEYDKTKRMLDVISYKMSQHQPDIFTGEENEWFNDWSEKQCEQILAKNSCKTSENTIEKVDMTEYNKGFECGKQRVLKYPEDYGLCKKPAWK